MNFSEFWISASSIMNDERIFTFIKITMLILISNNFYLWIEELKDIALKIKVWDYINSNENIKKLKKAIYSEIFNFAVSNTSLQEEFDLDKTTDLLTSSIKQQFSFSFLSSSRSRIRKIQFFSKLNSDQQKSYRMMIEKYRKKKSQSTKSSTKLWR
jgi:hypothetical protein